MINQNFRDSPEDWNMLLRVKKLELILEGMYQRGGKIQLRI